MTDMTKVAEIEFDAIADQFYVGFESEFGIEDDTEILVFRDNLE